MAPSSVVSIWSYDGRSSRSDYFWVLLITSALGAVAGTLMVKGGALGFFSGVFFVAVLWVSMCACARRLHDVGHSGWWSLVALVPLANFLFGLYALFAPGQVQENEFGPPTSKPSSLPLLGDEVVKTPLPAASPMTVMAEVPLQNLAPSEMGGVEPMEEFWAQALQECDEKKMRPGLWAKAFADSQGQEAVAKAQYMRLRATQLQLEWSLLRDQAVAEQERALQAETVQQQALAAEQAIVLAKMSDDERTEALKPKGRCPNCSAVIKLESKSCPHCNAIFGSDSAWQIRALSSAEQAAFRVASKAMRTEAQTETSGTSVLPSVLLAVAPFLLFFLFIAFK